MVSGFYADNNRVQVVNDDDISFDSERPSIELFPESSRIVKTDFEIVFPSLIQGYAYYRNQAFNLNTTCELWSLLIWQEWGPSETFHNEIYYPQNPSGSIPGPTTRNLPPIVLGSVPPETTHLDIRVRLTRTQAPPPWYGVLDTPILFKEGEWVTLPGGSQPCETIGDATRLFEIVRSGNNVVLNRYQSCRNYDTLLAPGGYPQANIQVNQSGWNSAIFGTTEPLSPTLVPKTKYNIGHLIQRKGPDTNGNKRPGGDNPCSGTAPNLQSVYRGDIVITPGRYRT